MIEYFEQPDYRVFPEGEFFEPKRAKLEQIESDWRVMGTVSETDFEYIAAKARQFWTLFNFASEMRLTMHGELIAKDFEIESLKHQLKEALGH
jgi:hypothetical protein